MKSIKHNGKKLLAVLLALMIMLPITAIFVSAAPPEVTVELEVFAGSSWASFTATFDPPLEEFDEKPRYIWVLRDSEGDEVEGASFSSLNGWRTDVSNLPYGDYVMILTVFFGSYPISADPVEFTVAKAYPEADLDIKDLDDAVWDDCYIMLYNRFNFTKASWEKFEAAWFAAREVLYDAIDGCEQLVQADVDTAALNLRNAYAALVKLETELDISALYDALYEECNIDFWFWYHYSRESWEAFEDAWFDGEYMLYLIWSGSTNFTQENIDKAAEAIITAFYALSENVLTMLDIDDLIYAVYYSCRPSYFNSWQYTAESWNRFVDVWYDTYEMLWEIYWDYDDYYDEYYFSFIYTQDDIDEAVEKLYTARYGLVSRGGIFNLTIVSILVQMWNGRSDVWDWILEPFYFIYEWIMAPYYALRDIIR